MHSERFTKVLLLFSLAIFAGGCGMFAPGGTRYGIRPAAPAADVEFENPPVIQAMTSEGSMEGRTSGSLFTPSASKWAPFGNPVATNIGDAVTVSIDLSVGAERAATTVLSRDSQIEAGIKSLMGYETEIADLGPNPSDPEKLVSASSKNSFEGNGDTDEAMKMTAEITAIVTHVYENGNMIIHGSQSTLVNNEKMLVVVDGVIRKDDISTQNVIDARRIANSRIEMSGKGPVGDKQKPGWLTRLFDGNRINFARLLTDSTTLIP